MGRPRLLRPGAQPHRLRPRDRAARRIPANLGGAVALPGLGAYTAAAIAAIAFGERAAVVDTNVARVIARLHALANPSARQIRDLMLAMTPADRPGDFVQAMMDLGATICRPKAPDCAACPLRGQCAGFASGMPEAFPRAKAQARSAAAARNRLVDRARRQGLAGPPPAKGLLGGMAALPGSDWSAEPRRASPRRSGPSATSSPISRSTSARAARRAVGGGWWQPIDRLGEAGLPSLYRRAAQLALRRCARSA